MGYLRPRSLGEHESPRIDGKGTVRLLLRALDTFDKTYMAWQWLDDPEEKVVHNHVYELTAEEWEPAREGLEAAQIDGRTVAQSLMSTLEGERKLMRTIAGLAVPREWWDQLHRAVDNGLGVHIYVTPSPRLAQVPWDLLISPVNGERLLRLARITYEAQYTIHRSRTRLPEDPPKGEDAPLRTVDVDPRGAGLRNTLSMTVLTQVARTRLTKAWGLSLDPRPRISRADLSEKLRGKDGAEPTRWLYVGHVSGEDEVGLTAIHLSDVPAKDPLKDDESLLPWFGYAKPIGSHYPFTARDMHLGTLDETKMLDQDQYRLPAKPNTPGTEIWPMPPRVAFIACGSGADHKASEIFGLASAALSAGAAWVTGTRWTIPTDLPFERVRRADGEGVVTPMADLVLAVDKAHQADEPDIALREWQKKRLAEWEEHGRLEDTPLLWGSLMTYWMPARPELKGPDADLGNAEA